MTEMCKGRYVIIIHMSTIIPRLYEEIVPDYWLKINGEVLFNETTSGRLLIEVIKMLLPFWVNDNEIKFWNYIYK